MSTESTSLEIKKGRLIKIIPTAGKKMSFHFKGNTWLELKTFLQEGRLDDNTSFTPYNFHNVKCVESIRKTTLEHPDALIPEEDFSLYFLTIKSKSGGEVREKVKEIFQKDKEAARLHFGNYTQKKEADLEELLKTWRHTGKNPDKTNRREKSPVRVEKSAKKERVKKDRNKQKEVAPIQELQEEPVVDEIVVPSLASIVTIVTSNLDEDGQKALVEILCNRLQIAIPTLEVKKEVESEEIDPEEERRIKEKEDAQDAQELRRVMEGFPDVKKY